MFFSGTAALIASSAFVVLVVGAFLLAVVFLWEDTDGLRARAAYFFAGVFASLLVAVFAFGELAEAAGDAVADQPAGTLCGIETDAENEDVVGAAGAVRAQQPPPIQPPPTQPPFEFPTIEPPVFPQPTLEIPDIPVPSIEVPDFPFPSPIIPDLPSIPSCDEVGARERAPAKAVRSGTLLVLATGLVWANAAGARTLLRKENE